MPITTTLETGEERLMIFGKHINRYYLKFGPVLLLGLVALVAVDYLQLEIPKLYGAVINGINTGFVSISS